MLRSRRRRSAGGIPSLALTLYPISQAVAVQELHHEVVAAVGEPAEREDVDDVGVADLVDGAGLVDEPAHQLRVVGDVLSQDLDRDPLADHRLDRQVDGPHSPFADLAGDAVLAHLHPGGQIAGTERVPPPTIDRRVVIVRLCHGRG